MYQLKIGTIPLPKLYVCTNKNDADKCKELGIPYVIKPATWDDDRLVKAVLWHTLEKKFPHIKWNKVLHCRFFDCNMPDVHIPEKIKVQAEYRENPLIEDAISSPDMEVTEGGAYRETGGGFDPGDDTDFSQADKLQRLDKYIGDLSYHVNIEELQALKLLPVFLDDIANAIKTNLLNTSYMDGYNKKLECNMGAWKGNDQAPNLIILDVSGSIPSGVAATMVSLIETLRHQANADLIITSRRSEYWAANTELPNPDQLAIMIGGCNECIQFYDILKNHILGKHWGNVIIFGDQDSPMREDIQRRLKRKGLSKYDVNIKQQELQSTRIDRIMAFHTYEHKIPGYGLWAKDAAPRAEVVINNSWVDDIY